MESGDFLRLVVVIIPFVCLVVSGFFMKHKWSLLTRILSLVFMVLGMTGGVFMWLGLSDSSYTMTLIRAIGLCGGISVLGVLVGTSILTKPIQELEKIMEEIAMTGDLSKRVAISTEGEVGSMAKSLNMMLDNTMEPVQALSKVSKTIASGDLSIDIEIETELKGDITDLVNSFGSMVDELRKVKGLKEKLKAKDEEMEERDTKLIKNLVATADLFVANAEELSASSEEITASSEEMASVIQQITHGTQFVAAKVDELQKQNKETNRITAGGAQSARSVGNKMAGVIGKIAQNTEAIKGLEDASREIVKIVDVIRGISEQTNMLALNAAVEAARAGDAGRGFAVVAEEVRKLAGKSSESTVKIEEVINNMKDKIDSSISGMEENAKMIEESGQAVQNAVRSFEEIPILIEQMDTAIDSMSGAAQDNAAGAEQSAASVEELSASMSNVSQSAQELLQASNELIAIAKGLENGTYTGTHIPQ